MTLRTRVTLRTRDSEAAARVHRIHPAPAYPSYQLGYEDGEAHGEAKNQHHVVRQLLSQLDASRVAELLGLDLAEVERIAAAQDDDATRDDQQTG